MIDTLRTRLHRALTSDKGDRFTVVRVQRDLARRVNAALGEPICSPEEHARRQRGREALAAQRRATPAPAEPLAPTAPVFVYRERDRNVREVERVRELLDAKSVSYKLLDVADDEGSLDFVLREAKCERDALPVVFVGTAAVGPYAALVEWEATGRLDDALRGVTPA